MAKSSLEAIGADTDQWIPYLHKEAELGNPDAMLILSQMYRDGDGVEQNLEKAEHYAEMERNAPPFHLQLIKDAEKGDRDAMSILSEIYREGDGVPQDLEKAKYYDELHRRTKPSLPYDENPWGGSRKMEKV